MGDMEGGLGPGSGGSSGGGKPEQHRWSSKPSSHAKKLADAKAKRIRHAKLKTKRKLARKARKNR